MHLRTSMSLQRVVAGKLIIAHCAAQWVQILDILQEAGLGDDFALRMCEELLLSSGASPAADPRTEDKKARDAEPLPGCVTSGSDATGYGGYAGQTERKLLSPGLQLWFSCCAGAVQVHPDVGVGPGTAAGSDGEGARGVHQHRQQPRSSPSEGAGSLFVLLRLLLTLRRELLTTGRPWRLNGNT
jgi:hypothetical protein